MPDNEDQFAVLKRTYLHNVPAEALFFSNASNGSKALRLEVAEIGKEFTDNVDIGKGASSLHLK